MSAFTFLKRFLYPLYYFPYNLPSKSNMHLGLSHLPFAGTCFQSGLNDKRLGFQLEAFSS